MMQPINSAIEISTPSWMSDEVAQTVQDITQILCNSLAENCPDGVNGVAVTYAMMNMIVGALGSAFAAAEDPSTKANVLMVSTSLGALFMDNFEDMQSKVPPDMVKLIMETGGNA